MFRPPKNQIPVTTRGHNRARAQQPPKRVAQQQTPRDKDPEQNFIQQRCGHNPSQRKRTENHAQRTNIQTFVGGSLFSVEPQTLFRQSQPKQDNAVTSYYSLF